MDIGLGDSNPVVILMIQGIMFLITCFFFIGQWKKIINKHVVHLIRKK